ncbi:MAG: ferritin family protein [Bacillota bacterium]
MSGKEEYDLLWEDVYNPDLESVLEMIRSAIASERSDRQFYTRLAELAPGDEEREIINDIKEDEARHARMFREIYREICGSQPAFSEEDNENDENNRWIEYTAGLREALFDEPEAVRLYRQIYFGMRSRRHRNMLFAIVTDEQIHADLFNYLYTRSMMNNL